MNETKEKLLRVKDAGDLIGVEANYIRVAEKHGLLVAVRDWAGQRRFKESAVLEFRRKLLAGELSRASATANGGEAA